MAIQSASAKLYTGIRCWVVDKNISAALTSSFSLGHLTKISDGPPPVLDFPVLSGVLAFKIIRAIADLVSIRSLTLADSRLKTFGGGNTTPDGYFILGRRYTISTLGSTDWNTVAGTTGVTYVKGSEFTSATAGAYGTGRAQLQSWTVKSTVVCKFPTYFRIDVDKLQLPQGTTCTVSFEEDWIRDGVYLESTKSPSPAIGNFFTFRTPWLGASFMNSTFTGLGSFVFRTRPVSMFVNSAFAPVMTGRLTRQGVTDLQSAFTAVIRAGEIVRLLSRADLFVVAGPIGPGSMPYLEGNGYNYPPGSPFEYLNAPPPWTWPGILRIRQNSATIASSTSLSAEVYNLPYIVPAVNYTSAFTMSANCDAFKGVGTPSLVATTSMSSSARVDYNGTVPTMQSTATVFCRTPVQGQASIVCASSVSATEGSKLELVWELLASNTTLGLVLKGSSAMNLTVEWIYRAGTAGETPISTETLTSVGAYNPDIADAPVSYFYSKNFGALDTDEVTVRISGNYNGFQTSKNGVDTINGEINSDTALSVILFSGNPWLVPGRTRLLRCVSWGNATNLNGAFANCINLNSVPNYIPKNSSVGTMFLNCVQMNSANCINWNTTTLTNFSGMFRGAIRFTQNIGSWNTSNVTNMRNMFNMQEHIGGSYGYPVSFPNTNTFNWNVTNVSRDNMQGMFRQHTGANLQLSSWCVSHIATMPANWTFQTTTAWQTARRPLWGAAC